MISEILDLMSKILVIDKDIATANALERLCQALTLPVDTVQTHANATRSYHRDPVAAIFLSSDMPMLDPRALVDELDAISAQKERPRAPVIIMYKDEVLFRRLGLNTIPRSRSMPKPISMEEVYQLFAAMGLTKVNLTGGSDHQVKERLIQHAKFIEESEAWLTKLKAKLFKS